MKATKIQYSIPDPCEKSWNEMTPESTGRFCGSCEKSVVDFTAMSDFSIVNYLEKHKDEKVCGRFTKPQLDRVYSLHQPVFAPVFDLRAVVLGLALTTFSAIHSLGQTETPEPVQIDTTITVPPIVIGTVAHPDFDNPGEKKVSGTITNQLETYQWISVHLKTEKGKVLQTVHPDAKGNFSLEPDWKKKPAYIEIEAPGFETAQRAFSSMNSLSDIRIELLEQPVMIGQVIKGNVIETNSPAEDQILQKIEIGNVSILKSEK